VPPSRRLTAQRERNLERAAKLFADFSGHEPGEILEADAPDLREGLVVGHADGVLYETVRDGRTERYIHKFKKRSRPLLVSNHDGSALGLIGGSFRFTDRGIVDD
jgi:hypothetical protein